MVAQRARGAVADTDADRTEPRPRSADTAPLSRTESPPLLRTQALTLRAGGRVLVRALDWQVHAGERWCVIGRNASGKSSLLRALAGLAVPERHGAIDWLGRPQGDWSAPDAALLRAFAPQHAADRFPLSVERLLALSTLRPGALDAAQVLQALDALPLARRNVLQLSGGERQRVALAQCALQGAPLLLMDEPVSFQDPAHQQQVARWLRGLVGAGTEPGVPGQCGMPRALVLTAHDVNWIAATATHVLALWGDAEGGWRAGPAAELLDAALLQQVYGCGWRQMGGVWQAL